ncbi:MAG TPA: sugar phosphate isomerase/epimerase family protein [Tepidisphaeraceae bacterium]|jgi:sugar phosphate isomerase/epimerase
MKLTISTLVCPAWTLPQIIDALHRTGINGIDFRGIGEEIDITKLPQFNQHLADTLGQLRSHKIEVPCLNTSITLVTPAAQRWQMMLEEAQRTVTLAEKSHTRFVRIFGGSVPKELSRDEAVVLAKRHLRQLIKICAGYGCIPILETHDDWSTSDKVLELLHEFDPAEVGVLWDIEHPFRKGESPADTFAALKRFIRHVHVKDSVRIEGKNSPRLLGEGELPIKQCYSILKQQGYDGWICLETEKRWHAEAPNPDQSIPQFAVYMKQLELAQ